MLKEQSKNMTTRAPSSCAKERYDCVQKLAMYVLRPVFY